MRLRDLFFKALRPKLVLNVGISVASFLSPDLAAQQQRSRIVPDHSAVRLPIGARQDPKSFNIPPARISADARINPDNLEAVTFNLRVYAANENVVNVLHRQTLAADQPVANSNRSTQVKGATALLQVDGHFTVTEAERGLVDSPE